MRRRSPRRSFRRGRKVFTKRRRGGSRGPRRIGIRM